MGFIKNMIKTALIGVIFLPMVANAQIQITEIMYDLEGSDAKKEWVEICNLGNEEINITGWKFNDGSNHNLNKPPKNGGQGSLIISTQECAILTGNAETFLNLHTGYSGIVIDTVMSLNNTENTLSILNVEALEMDSVIYNKEMGASGDGNSLQKTNSGWIADIPTLGEFSNFPNNQDNNNGSDEPPVNILTTAINPPKQSIFADAGEDKTVIVGADTLFDGKAYGLKGELLENANYIWNFGDGTIKKGKKVLHSYNYPGKYVVFFDASSGAYSNSDRINVNALPADLTISNIEFGVDGFIELYNKTERELDLSWWRLGVDNNFFTIPKNTFILPNNKIIFSSNNTGLIIKNNNIKLLYPNGTVADGYKLKSNSVYDVVDYHLIKQTEGDLKSVQTINKTNLKTTPLKTIPLLSNKQSYEVSATNTAFIINSISDNSRVVNQKNDENTKSVYKWLLSISGIIFIAIIGIVFKKPKSKDNLSVESDEIEII